MCFNYHWFRLGTGQQFHLCFGVRVIAKKFIFDGNIYLIESAYELNINDAFFRKVYTVIYDLMVDGSSLPHINFDNLIPKRIGFSISKLAKQENIKFKIKKDKSDADQKAMWVFLEKYPYMFFLLQNFNANAKIEIKSAEFLLGDTVSSGNFIDIKEIIDRLNKSRWTRERNISERNSGVSTLGTISERLLATALDSLIDNINFFKTNTPSIQSYGDFVLMCLPNNLWLSVKSNYARERLLASGYTTDILGVGFFIDGTEFTSGAKIRNFQKVGFLAMYVPDIPITEEQIQTGVSTYDEIVSFYDDRGDVSFPLNINSRPFIRKLSNLHRDLTGLLSEADIKKRTTIGF